MYSIITCSVSLNALHSSASCSTPTFDFPYADCGSGVSFGVSSVTANEEDEQMIKEMQREAAYMDPTRAAAMLSRSQGEAMKAAASNTATGPAMAFMGMGMAGQMGGINAQNLYAMGQQQAAQQAAQQVRQAQGRHQGIGHRPAAHHPGHAHVAHQSQQAGKQGEQRQHPGRAGHTGTA